MSRPVYLLVRLILTPLLRGWFRVRATGLEHLPADGPVIVAPNHKSFLDPFFIGLVARRRLRYMAKVELFRGPLARLLPRLGAFPVRRGAGDPAAHATAAAILRQGGVVVVFPEGTRVEDRDVLGAPHHGAGTLALETGAPIVPAAVAGTSHLWFGPLPKPRLVRVAFLPPIEVASEPPTDEVLARIVDERLWPAVRQEYGRLIATRGLLAAALGAVGAGGVVARRRRDTPKLPRVVGMMEPRKLRRAAARRRRWPRRRG